jgi:hypothetical protein
MIERGELRLPEMQRRYVWRSIPLGTTQGGQQPPERLSRRRTDMKGAKRGTGGHGLGDGARQCASPIRSWHFASLLIAIVHFDPMLSHERCELVRKRCSFILLDQHVLDRHLMEKILCLRVCAPMRFELGLSQ